MNYLIEYLKWFPVLFVVTWLFFLGVMALKKARDTVGIPGPAKPFAYVILAIGYTLDFLLNLAFTVPMLDIPREFLLTDRLRRYKQSIGWRADFANWLCNSFLNFIDPGHC